MSGSRKRSVVSAFIAAAAVCAIGSSSSVASAGGQSVATTCVKVGTAGVIQYGGDGSITNLSSTENLTVSCPISWVLGDSNAGGVIEYVDSNGTFGFTCTIRAETQLSGAAVTQSVSSPGGTNANAYLTMTVAQTASISNGGVHLVCTIPRLESGTNEISALVSHTMQ